MDAKPTPEHVTLKIQRGNIDEGFSQVELTVKVEPGMVVLDAVHLAQAQTIPDLAVRWNCKAGKCGSCSAEVNGKPRLMCMTKLSELDDNRPIDIRPLKAFPVVKDLVTDVSWNYEINQRIRKYQHPPKDSKLVDPVTGEGIMLQHQIDRIQEFRKCIECFLCQNVCHVLRTNEKFEKFAGPRFMAKLASLEMHPLDQDKNRINDVKDIHHVGYCNITRCCTEVCPEHITITDNAIIPLKERITSEFYDPIAKLSRFIAKLL
jgi:succinate dehydrogenase / fumarate reductase iron-sulfur subunit